MAPFVKWIGGKGAMLVYLRSALPARFDRYYEPMVGGGALFWELIRSGRMLVGDGPQMGAPGALHGVRKPVFLSDTNEWLVKTYEAVRGFPADLIEILTDMEAEYLKRPEQFYYEQRGKWNVGEQSAARFIFLKQTAFNGLWRYNTKGLLNMPWGHYQRPKICDAAGIMACAEMLSGVELRWDPYRTMVYEMRPGDLVYFDPPYLGTFNNYSSGGFTKAQHRELIDVCADLTAKGVHVMYTHAEHPLIWTWLDELWPMAKVVACPVRRMVNRDGGGRQLVTDLLVSSSTTPRNARSMQLPLPFGEPLDQEENPAGR